MTPRAESAAAMTLACLTLAVVLFAVSVAVFGGAEAVASR